MQKVQRAGSRRDHVEASSFPFTVESDGQSSVLAAMTCDHSREVLPGAHAHVSPGVWRFNQASIT